VRSDSDLFTYGYRFKPWRGPSIAAGEEILDYLDEVIDEDDLGPHIRYHHRATAASWSTEDRRWTVEVTRGDTGEQLQYTTDFLWMCQGYYNHAKPYQPRWEGMDRFQGWSCTPSSGPGPRPRRQARRRHRVGVHRRHADPRRSRRRRRT
jgi:cation diffusion facilitator CzcD-associated flavoprotein CzcO